MHHLSLSLSIYLENFPIKLCFIGMATMKKKSNYKMVTYL